MNNFTIKETPIKGLAVIEPKVFGDERGFFMETYNKKSFEELDLQWTSFKITIQNLKKAFYVDFTSRQSTLKGN